MNFSDILPLLLAPASIALLVLYLQQLAKVTELRGDAESKERRIEGLSNTLRKSVEHYEEALRAARLWYDARVDESETQKQHFQKLHSASQDVIKAMNSAYTDLHDLKFSNRWTGPKPKFSANRESTEPFRLERLAAVWNYALSIAELGGNTDFKTKVLELHDHKGLLTVTWKETPADADKKIIEVAWESDVGDNFAGGVSHEEVASS